MEACCDRIKESFSFVDHAISNQKMEYQKWFDQAPEFHSSNALLDRTWAYRWFIYRHSMMKPERGNLKDTFFCEGRSHKMTKTPYEPDGWEFTKLIPLSVRCTFWTCGGMEKKTMEKQFCIPCGKIRMKKENFTVQSKLAWKCLCEFFWLVRMAILSSVRDMAYARGSITAY